MPDLWQASSSILKHYRHFDAPLRLREVERIVRSPERVAANAFFPFLRYFERWQPFRLCPDGKPKKKERPIRYASRRDAYIYSYYRSLLSPPYEELLKTRKISDCVIAYRKIGRSDGASGKCNIDFAKDVFDEIGRQANCIAVGLDISSFFENLSHDHIYRTWCNLLGKRKLPPDHLQVFKNITKYSYVDEHDVYKRLGFVSEDIQNGRSVVSHIVPFDKIPKQLCTPDVFRRKIAGQDPRYSNLILKNLNEHGIPQGSPISDLLANSYLLDFDVSMTEFAQKYGGLYRRYSDDIVLIAPCSKISPDDVFDYTINQINIYAPKLHIKPEKTCCVQYSQGANDVLSFKHLSGPQGRNGFEYLGFRYDGVKIYLRDATVSRFFRKLAIGSRLAAREHVARYPGKDVSFLIDRFDYSALAERFGRVENFDISLADYKKWTFWTYAKRASERFGTNGSPILHQIRNYRQFMRDRFGRAVVDLLSDEH